MKNQTQNYGWRQLDPQLGVWHCVDKLASSTPNVSPYAYANNNPVNNIDVAGLSSQRFRDSFNATSGGYNNRGFDTFEGGSFFGNGGGSFGGGLNGTISASDTYNANFENSYFMGADGEAHSNWWLNNEYKKDVVYSKNYLTGQEYYADKQNNFNNQRQQNSKMITRGLFKGNTRQIISRFTWELPQTIVGFMLAQCYNLFGNVAAVEYYDGLTHIKTTNTALITIGSYMITSNFGGEFVKTVPENYDFQHEYGHYIQSQILGPFWFPIIAIPSIISASTDFSIDGRYHDNYFTEQSANYLSNNYFQNRISNFKFDSRNPMIPFKNWEFLFLKRIFN